MAEYLLKDKLDDDESERLEVTSAGVAALEGRPASPPAVEALKEIGIDGIIMHTARSVHELEVCSGDLILTMTRSHMHRLPDSVRESPVRTSLLKEFVGQKGRISDPYGAGIERYRSLRDELQSIIQSVYERLSRTNFEPY